MDARNCQWMDTTYIDRFSRRVAEETALVCGSDGSYPHCRLPKRSFFSWLEFPFASVSIVVVLLSLFLLSMFLGGWTWSSWIYAFALGISLPLVAFEKKRKAIITGGAALLLTFMVIIDAGMPQYFGYSVSDLSAYDLTAHYIGALVLTLFLWSFLGWSLSPSGPPRRNGYRMFFVTVITMLMVVTIFEFLELVTDTLFGWTNFHAGVDTIGDFIFDIAGVMTAAVVIARHKVSVLKRPFWHAEAVRAQGRPRAIRAPAHLSP